MAFLSGLAANIAKWLLENLGAYLFKIFKRARKDKAIDQDIDKDTEAVENVLAEIKKVEEQIKKNQELRKSTVLLEKKIKDLEKRLRDATRNTNIDR